MPNKSFKKPFFTYYSKIRYLLLFAFILLNGCSHLPNKDGPPNFYVDETRIPNAVPKIEPLSRGGNKPFYSVFGKRYYVLSSSSNYEQRGTASWYGKKFHSRFTSNGEKYDMLGMTAAHKTLPLPTYVEVTNLANGRKVIVKVNDRGPFESNRLIDLSYVAAKKLGMLGHGTANVDVKAIDPRDLSIQRPQWLAKNTTTVSTAIHRNPYTRIVKTKISHTSHLYLQVGAFHSRVNAEKLRKQLIALLSSPVKIHSSNNLFRVQVGPFKDSLTADRANKRLQKIGLHATKHVSGNVDIL
jgi:rare lipoprotein A